MDNQALFKKMRILEGNQILVLNAPPGFLENLKPYPPKASVHTKNDGVSKLFNVVLLFVENSKELHLFGDEAINSMGEKGILWIAYPKKSSGIKSDLTRDEGWTFLDPYFLSGVSNVAIDDIWSGLRFKKNEEGKSHNQIMTEFKNRDRSPESKVVVVPPDFQVALNGNPAALHVFNNFAYTHRKEYVRWIEEAKKQETRENRIQKAVERIAQNIKFS